MLQAHLALLSPQDLHPAPPRTLNVHSCCPRLGPMKAAKGSEGARQAQVSEAPAPQQAVPSSPKPGGSGGFSLADHSWECSGRTQEVPIEEPPAVAGEGPGPRPRAPSGHTLPSTGRRAPQGFLGSPAEGAKQVGGLQCQVLTIYLGGWGQPGRVAGEHVVGQACMAITSLAGLGMGAPSPVPSHSVSCLQCERSAGALTRSFTEHR